MRKCFFGKNKGFYYGLNHTGSSFLFESWYLSCVSKEQKNSVEDIIKINFFNSKLFVIVNEKWEISF